MTCAATTRSDVKEIASIAPGAGVLVQAICAVVITLLASVFGDLKIASSARAA